MEPLMQVTGGAFNAIASTPSPQAEKISDETAYPLFPAETIDLSGTMPLPDAGDKKRHVAPADAAPCGTVPTPPPSSPGKEAAVPAFLTMGENSTGISSAITPACSDQGPDFVRKFDMESTRELWADVITLKAGGGSVQPETVLEVYQKLKQRAGETDSPVIKLLQSRCTVRAERAQALMESRKACHRSTGIEESQSAEESQKIACSAEPPCDRAFSEKAFMDPGTPWLGEKQWETLARSIGSGAWIPDSSQMEMLKARLTVPSAVAGNSIFGRDAQDDIDFRGGLKVLCALQDKDPSCLAQMLLPDRQGNDVPLPLAMADKLINDPQGDNFLGPIRTMNEPPQSAVKDMLRDMTGLIGRDDQVVAHLMEKATPFFSGTMTVEGGKGSLALGLLWYLDKDRDTAERLDAVISKLLKKNMKTGSLSSLLNARRNESCLQQAQKIMSGICAPREIADTISDILVKAYCTHNPHKVIDSSLPAITEGLAELQKSPGYADTLKALTGKTEAAIDRVKTVGKMEMPELAALQTLYLIAQRDPSVRPGLQKILKFSEQEVRKTSPKGGNAETGSYILGDFRKIVLQDAAAKFQSSDSSPWDRLALYQRIMSTLSLRSYDTLTGELQKAFCRGLEHDTISGMADLPKHFDNEKRAVDACVRLANGKKKDSDLGGSWRRICDVTDHCTEYMAKLQSGAIPLPERFRLLNDYEESARVLFTRESSDMKENWRNGICRLLEGTPGLESLPAYFNNPDKTIRVYRLLASGADKDEDIVPKWQKFCQILDITDRGRNLNETIRLYDLAEKQEKSGQSWDDIITGLYYTRIQGGDSSTCFESVSEDAEPISIDDLGDGEISIGGMRLRKRQDPGDSD